jgi:hypothetical protein
MQSTCETFLAGTAFHMDLGFIRVPKIIKDENGQSKTTKTTTAQLSHNGYSAYLIIVDAATRYVFCFPLKSRSPPSHELIGSSAKMDKPKATLLAPPLMASCINPQASRTHAKSMDMPRLLISY